MNCRNCNKTLKNKWIDLGFLPPSNNYLSKKDLIKKFEENKAEIYIVGGAVRDLMLRREVKDWDFTTNLTPDEMKKIFPKNSFCKH